MGRSTDRTRARVRRRPKGGGTASIKESPWFDYRLALLTPTPVQRRDWDRLRRTVWLKWSEMPPEERPFGNKHAPIAACVIDWDNHLGPNPLTTEALEEYTDLAGPGFESCKEYLLTLL